MTMRSVASLLHGPRDLTETVAMLGSTRIDVGRLRQDVAANVERLAGMTCRRGLLVSEDTYWAVVGMLTLFQIGAEVVLPQNVTAGATVAIAGQWDLLVCDRLPDGQSQGFVLQAGIATKGELKQLDPTDCRLNLFTSGSTGVPKQVVKTLAIMEREAAAIEEIIGRDVPSDARVVGTVTHQHLFGLAYKLFWPLCSGRYVDGVVHELWEGLLSQDLYGAAIVTSPAHLTRLGEMDPLRKGSQPSCVLSAGALLPLSASGAAARIFGAPICEIFGSTETGTVAWRQRDRLELPWQPMPGVSIARGPDGVLSLRSPFLPDTSVFQGSDLIELDQSGGFHLKGRVDRIVKIEGKRISLPEVEAQLCALPWVSAAAAVALPGDQPVLGAVIVPSEAGARELANLGAFRFGRLLRGALETSQEAAGKPRRWRFVDALPKNDMGKFLQRDLATLFLPKQRPTEPDLVGIRRNGDRVEIDLYNAPDLQQLDGHFPGMPIIPGVAQIDWAVKFAARYLDLPIEVATAYQVKFHRLTLPETMVTLKMEHDSARRRLSFAYHQAEQVLTSGSIRMPVS